MKTVYSTVPPPSVIVFSYKENIVDIWSQHFFEKKKDAPAHISVCEPCGFYLFLEMEGSAGGSIKDHKLSPNSEDCKGKGEYQCQK